MLCKISCFEIGIYSEMYFRLLWEQCAKVACQYHLWKSNWEKFLSNLISKLLTILLNMSTTIYIGTFYGVAMCSVLSTQVIFAPIIFAAYQARKSHPRKWWWWSPLNYSKSWWIIQQQQIILPTSKLLCPQGMSNKVARSSTL